MTGGRWLRTHSTQTRCDALSTASQLYRKQGIFVMNALHKELWAVLRKELQADRLLQSIVDQMATMLEADRASIFLLNPQGSELISVAAHLPEMKEIRVPIDQGIAGYVARTGALVNIPYCQEDKRFWQQVDQQTGYTTLSMLSGPLYDAQKKLIGVVQFLNKQNGIFTATDEERFVLLAEEVSALLRDTTIGHAPNYLPISEHVPSIDMGATEVVDPLPLGDRINMFVGQGASMREILQMIRRVAPTDATVLLRGESGTGKSLVARALHHNSSRHNGPFIQVDCTTLPEGLIENELFGHERGAYTGAHTSNKGKVEMASGGTLFLDEIGDLPPLMQGKLLTLLQERTYHRVGGSQRQKADIRIITATNRPLEQLVRAGRFREDLYYRLRVVQIEMPPLRSRGKDDLIRLINFFIDAASRRHHRDVRTLSPEALRRLLSYDWPGNVRELENCLESAVIFSDGVITLQSLMLPSLEDQEAEAKPPFAVGHQEEEVFWRGISSASSMLLGPTTPPARVSMPAHPFEDEPTLRELENRYIQFLLQRYNGNRTECARVLGIGRNTLLRKLKGPDGEESGASEDKDNV